MQKMKGVIISVFPNKGYAFARSTEDRLTYFIHARDMEKREDFETLREGVTVEFYAHDTGKGNRGKDIAVCQTKKEEPPKAPLTPAPGTPVSVAPTSALPSSAR